MKQDNRKLSTLKSQISAEERQQVVALNYQEMQRTLGGKALRPLFMEHSFGSVCISSLKQ